MEEDEIQATQPVDDRVLKNVIAYVEVRSTNDNRSRAICKELVQLGAVVETKFTDDVTHVIFKEGSKRTINKAQKRDIHLVSVLWVDSCKRNQEHVSERLYPATLPNQKGTPLLLTKLKKAKSMQPVDFEEELASSAERCAKRKKKVVGHPVSKSGTPCNSPLLNSRVLVMDTQPRTPMDDCTPVRLTIPDTPPSMRAKLQAFREARGKDSDIDCETEDPLASPHTIDLPLQRKLSFGGVKQTNNDSVLNLDNLSDIASSSQKQQLCSEKSSSVQMTEKSSAVKRRRKSVASVRFSDNIDTSGKKTTTSKSRRKSSVMPVQCSSSMDTDTQKTVIDHASETSKVTEDKAKSAKQGKRKSMSGISCQNQPASEKTDGKQSMSDNQPMDTKTGGKQVARYTINSLSGGHVENISDQIKPQETARSRRSKRRSAMIGSELIESDTIQNVGIKDNTVVCDDVDEPDSGFTLSKPDSMVNEGLNEDTVNVVSFNEISASNKPKSIKKTNSKKKLLASSDLDPHSFLIEPNTCSDKARSDILLDGTANCTSKTKGKRKRNVDSLDSTSSSEQTDRTRVKRSCISNNEERILPAFVNESILRSQTAVTLSNDSVQSEGELGASMSAVFSESTYPIFSCKPPPRQSIDEFNLRTNFSQRNVKRKKLKSESSVKRHFSDSSCPSSESDSYDQQRKRSPYKPAIVMTSLHSHEQDIVISVVKKLGGFTISDNVTEHTTHVICGGPRRTLNILHAITRGCWVISKDWVLQSLEKENWLPELPYEVTDWFPTVKVVRELKELSEQNFYLTLFSGQGPFYISTKSSPPRHHLVTLIKASGGQITSSTMKSKIYIGQEFYPDKVSVTPLWILDCITQNKLLDTEKYLLGQPKRESSPEY